MIEATIGTVDGIIARGKIADLLDNEAAGFSRDDIAACLRMLSQIVKDTVALDPDLVIVALRDLLEAGPLRDSLDEDDERILQAIFKEVWDLTPGE